MCSCKSRTTATAALTLALVCALFFTTTPADAFAIRPNVLDALTHQTSLSAALVDSSSSSLSEQSALYPKKDQRSSSGLSAATRAAAAPVVAALAAATAAATAAAAAAATPSSSTPPTATTTVAPRLHPHEVPRHRDAEQALARAVLETELALGRTAMVAAVVLLAGEVMTGQSLPDQIASFIFQ